MHVGWRRQHGNARGLRDVLAMIGGENWQVALGATAVARHMLNRLSSKQVSVRLPVVDK